MPKRTLDGEFSAAIRRLRAWKWLEYLRDASGLSFSALHQSISVPRGDRGPLFDVKRDGADPGRIRVGRLTLQQAFAEMDFAAPAEVAYCHPVWKALQPTSPPWDMLTRDVSRCLHRCGLVLLTDASMGRLVTLGLRGYATYECLSIDAPLTYSSAEPLRRVSELDALLIALHTYISLLRADDDSDGEVLRPWRTALDWAFETVSESLPPEGATWLQVAIENACHRACGLQAPPELLVKELMYRRDPREWRTSKSHERERALLGHQTSKASRAVQRQTRLAYVLALRHRRRASACGCVLLRTNPWLRYFEENEEILSVRLDAATNEMFGFDDHQQVEPLAPLPVWEGHRVQGLTPHFLHLAHDTFSDHPLVSIRRELVGMPPSRDPYSLPFSPTADDMPTE